jgi:ABC-type phosphate/phosphonate transport system substrate-binding protein
MPSASRLRRLAQVVAAAAFAFGAWAPAALVTTSPAAAADPVTLRVGITQTATDTALNPFLAESGLADDARRL